VKRCTKEAVFEHAAELRERGEPSSGALLGLSVTGLAVLINTALGLTSLNHGLKSK
jgi:hypothetical protein